MQTSVNSRRLGPAPRLMPVIAVLAALGIAISSASLWHHFSHDKTSFCDFGQTFNCDLVNRSEFSVFAGVPVALIGILGYLLLLALATLYRQKAETPALLLIFSASGLAFALRLAYFEAYRLHAWCILCLSSLAVIALIAMLSAGYLASSVREG